MNEWNNLPSPNKQTNEKYKKNKVKNDQNKSAEMVAAVGVGMVPATMALLMPMILGRRRRRRSVDTETASNLDLEKSTQSMNQPIYQLFM